MNFSHLKEVEESYLSHMFFSFKLFCMLNILSYVSLVHAILPFVMADTVSEKIENIKTALLARS